MDTLNQVEIAEVTIQLRGAVRDKVVEICAAEGATLNQFVSIAVAEKLEHYAHLQWLKRRKVPTPESILNARRMLRRAGDDPPEPGDELPEGFVLPEL